MRVLFLVLLMCALPTWASAPKTIVFIGDSLTEGYGLEPEEAYPAQLEKMLHAQGKKDYKILNGGISGSTTANAAQRVRWYLKSKPHLLVLVLGANDGLRGLPVSQSRANIVAALKLAQESGVKILLGEMKLPRNYGEAYRKEFEAMYGDIAKSQNVPLLLFLLEGVGGVPKLNQPDGIHPTAEGQKKIAENMLKALGPHL